MPTADPAVMDGARLHRRFSPLRTRAVGDQTIVSCIAVAWGSRNSYGEVFVPGAFADDLATHSDRKPIVMGLYHDRAIGKWSAASEGEAGLALEGPISDTSDGRDAATLVRDGALTGVSIGFFLDQYQYAGPGERVTFQTPFGERSYVFDDYVWYVLKARVVEASLVMAPSDDDARIVDVRSAAVRALPALRDLEHADWDDVAYSMALLMGARGAGSFADLPDGDRREMYAEIAGAYQRHGKTPPDFTPSPSYGDIEFRHDEREVFHDRYLRKSIDAVVAGASGASGPLSAGTREAAQRAVEALTPLLAPEQAEGSQLARLRSELDALTTSLKETP